MFINELSACKPFRAGDETLLRELLHPSAGGLEITYSLAHAVVAPGQTTLPHRLRTSEVYYILAGNGIMCINDEQAPVKPGHVIYIPPGACQSIHNPGVADLVFLCIVQPAWRPEDEEIL